MFDDLTIWASHLYRPFPLALPCIKELDIFITLTFSTYTTAYASTPAISRTRRIVFLHVLDTSLTVACILCFVSVFLHSSEVAHLIPLVSRICFFPTISVAAQLCRNISTGIKKAACSGLRMLFSSRLGYFSVALNLATQGAVGEA